MDEGATIDQLRLSTRTRNVLQTRFVFVHEVAKATTLELMLIKGFGIGSLDELRDALEDFGVHKAEAHRLAHKLRDPKFYTARTKRAVNSLTVERGPKVVSHE